MKDLLATMIDLDRIVKKTPFLENDFS